MLRVLVDDHDLTTRLDHATQVGHRRLHVNRVLQRLGSESAIESSWPKRERGERALTAFDPFGNKMEHRRRQIEGRESRLRKAFLQNARESAFAAAGVERAAAVQIAEELDQQLNMIDPRVDGRGKILLVLGRFVEMFDDFAQIRRRRLPLPECAHQARVRKMGRPALFS